MNSLTRQFARLSTTAARASYTSTAAPALAFAARRPQPSRRPVASTSSLSLSRGYATEASHLGNLSPSPGSAHKVRCRFSFARFRTIADSVGHATLQRKRIGRGIGSGRGGTSGRGHKGQGARSGNGKPALHFAGGQTPLTRAYPKRGFKNPSVGNCLHSRLASRLTRARTLAQSQPANGSAQSGSSAALDRSRSDRSY